METDQKLDMSLDEIIKLKGKNRGKGRGGKVNRGQNSFRRGTGRSPRGRGIQKRQAAFNKQVRQPVRRNFLILYINIERNKIK